MLPCGHTAVALQVLPDGLVVPPLTYLAGLAVGLAVVVGSLTAQRPAITRRTIVAFGPWMVAGAAVHALYQLGSAPPILVPLFTAPTVYLTTFLFAGAVWALATTLDSWSTPSILGGVGLVCGLLASAVVLQAGVARGTLAPMVAVIGLVTSVGLTAVVYWLLDRVRPSITAATGNLGLLVVFAHVLDGVSTAIGIDLLHTAERSPIPRAIMGFAGSLPTASLIGTGWLFVLVKLAVAVTVLALLTDFVEEDPRQGYAALGVVAAVGLGPGAQNLLLFAAAGPI